MTAQQTRTLEDKIQALRLALRSLQQDQWECGYEDWRVQRISDIRAQLNAILAA